MSLTIHPSVFHLGGISISDSFRSILPSVTDVLSGSVDNPDAPVIESNILAGTSPGGLILSSPDGISWTNLGSAGKGNPLAFVKRPNGDIVYSTDLGWVINYTTSESIKLSDYPIKSIINTNAGIYVADTNGHTFDTDGQSSIITEWVDTPIESVDGNVINQILWPNNSDVLILSSIGITLYTLSSTLQQTGNFICACDVGNGFVYAGTNDGHIWKNTTIYDYRAWTDLGRPEFFYPINNIIKTSTGFVYSYSEIGSFTYTFTDNTLLALGTTNGASYGEIVSMIKIDDSNFILGTNDGHFFTSDGIGHSSDHGQQFSQTSINCLIKI